VIAYELLVGKPAFPESLSWEQLCFIVCAKGGRPEIPAFVLPTARALIEDCWADDPDDRLTFDEIVDRLKKMKFKLTADVKSAKLLKFVEGIEEWERQNASE
jgi:hypothetical protein